MKDPTAPPFCPSCGREVDPEGEGVRYAVKVMRFEMAGGPRFREGLGDYFHAGCSVPSGSRQKAKPSRPSDRSTEPA